MEQSSTGTAVPDGGQTQSADKVVCRECASVIKEQAEICPECGVRQHPAGDKAPGGGDTEEAGGQPSGETGSSGDDDPLLATVLSLVVPGLGQFYNGEPGKGTAIFLGVVLSVQLLAVLVGFLSLPALWGWGIYDAYHSAEE